jgi:site-specific recombinase XerD
LGYIEKFLLHHFGKDPVNISQLSVKDIDSYVIDYAKRSRSSVPAIGAALKAYLRLRASRGDKTQSLLAAVPHVANWSRTTIPKILSDEELERVLQAFDVTTPMGQRNYAMTRCLIDLGLRSIEVTCLSLDSLDWREATVIVSCGKGKRFRKLPLPRRTGQAIARYLRHGRPKTSCRQLFVRHHPPYEEPITAYAIQKVIRRVFDRCNVGKNLGATHALRRTLATRLQQSGASLKEIADLLGHQDLQTTTVYAKVDVQGLRKIALPWPGSSL